jgi:hypothetical protein
MKLTVLIAAVALAGTACASSPRAVPNDNTPPPPPPADTNDVTAAAQPTVASPRDVARAEVAGATVAVDYGRPFMRGRKIFGGLVPYGQVWRTGANEATAFRTSADLEIGGVRVPAGSYTLYSMLREGSGGAVGEWTLIINRQTGQWGTEYDQTRDLARIPMRVTRLERPVEQFTVRVIAGGGTPSESTRMLYSSRPLSPGDPAMRGGTGRLLMMWENTQAEVDFRVAG